MTRKHLKVHEFVEGVHYRIPRSNFSTNTSEAERRVAQEKVMCAESLTFEMLHDVLASSNGSGSKSAANLVSALKGFVAFLGMEMSDLVGPIFRGTFYARLSEHLDDLIKVGRAASYVSNRKYFLKQCRRHVLKLDAQAAIANGMETPLGAALRSLQENVGDLAASCRRIGVSSRRIEAYIRGGTPGRGAFHTLQKMEIHFAMAPGSLTDLLPRGVQKPQWTLHGRRKQESRMPMSGANSPYRVRVSRARKDPYLLRPEEITDRFRQMWIEYTAYKTDPWAVALTSSGRPRKLSCWRCVDKPDRRPGLWDWVCEVNGQWCETAHHYFFVTSSFLGWLRKPVTWGGGGVDVTAALTLGWFADVSRVKANVEWRKRRAGNVVNGSYWKMLVHAAALCQPERGFLWRSEHIWRDFGYANVQSWREHCAESYKTYRQMMRVIKPQVRQSRDPFEPIKDIIAMDRPLDAVLDAIDRMDQDRPPPGGEAELVWARDRLLLSLMASNPLRARNLKELTWHADNSGDLRRDPDGNYRIFIPSARLKNHSGAGAKDYDVRVQPTLTPVIDKYLRDYAPRLSRGLTARIFVGTVRPELEWVGLNDAFCRLTKRYFVDSRGFGPHAMRHIVATALVKRHGSFTAAAKVLHDYEDTVRKHYGHLVGDDGARWVESLWVERSVSRVR